MNHTVAQILYAVSTEKSVRIEKFIFHQVVALDPTLVKFYGIKNVNMDPI